MNILEIRITECHSISVPDFQNLLFFTKDFLTYLLRLKYDHHVGLNLVLFKPDALIATLCNYVTRHIHMVIRINVIRTGF